MKNLISLLALAAICSACTTNQSVSESVCNGELVLLGYENVTKITDDRVIVKCVPVYVYIDENASKSVDVPEAVKKPELST